MTILLLALALWTLVQWCPITGAALAIAGLTAILLPSEPHHEHP